MKNLLVMLAAVSVIALPFLFGRRSERSEWRPGHPVLVVIAPHNEAIRQEFGEGFSAWHQTQYGVPVKVDWRVIGGTTEIMRYLVSQYAGSAQAWWGRRRRAWPAGGADRMFDPRFDPDTVPAEVAADPAARRQYEAQAALWREFRASDDPMQASSGIDVFFGGGMFDHGRAAAQGLTVPLWKPGGPDTEAGPESALYALMRDIPREAGGETWWTDTQLGTVLSTFGICYNPDRLRDLGIQTPPRVWRDLADIRYFGQIGVTDPTKSGSVAKAFEMIIHEQCARAVAAAGFGAETVSAYERQIAAARLPPGVMPDGVPETYQEAVARGWVDGINLVRLIGANARYFTDGAGKVPIDVGDGVAAAGIAIDFYGRFQAEAAKSPAGVARLVYVTPHGGSSVSADPISILRGAPHKKLALRFLLYVMSSDGQKLWNYRPGTPGGPKRFALCRLPIGRTFYPSNDPEGQAACEAHRAYTHDDLTDPDVDAYALAARFAYQPRWTARHFGIQRDLVRAMCLDAGDELRAAWRAIDDAGGSEAASEAMVLLQRLPDTPLPLNWVSAVGPYGEIRREDLLRGWTAFFRQSYREAEACARRTALPQP